MGTCAAMMVAVSLACGGTPAREATVIVDLPAVDALSDSDMHRIEQHMAADIAWDVRVEGGRRFAIAVPPGPKGEYTPTLNGYTKPPGVQKARVIVGLGQQYSGGGVITEVGAVDGTTLVLLDKRDWEEGGRSQLVVEGGGGLTIEVFEQSGIGERTFTIAALEHVSAALQRMAGQGGLTPGSVERTQGGARLEIADGREPGLYLATAWVNPQAHGVAHLEVTLIAESDAASTGDLSRSWVRERTARVVGWSPDPDERFRYRSHVSVLEGPDVTPFLARFELWFTPDDGPPRQLVAVARPIVPWTR
jgi:hypothetical protein